MASETMAETDSTFSAASAVLSEASESFSELSRLCAAQHCQRVSLASVIALDVALSERQAA